ncbi:hypothetical protein [Phenylobacterium sp.]|uniref:hypothetical protein n=1 Tax=Phenylobacterium sp. TaxID=1871053 RepID=UPI0027197214|nr:hypothetical protein [Phenylobacterium sp.]MDO8379280.1 hypothetical protein [Phenylobacterium sp.]
MFNKIFSLEPGSSAWAMVTRSVRALIADRGGLSTVEYSTMGGVMSGAIYMAGQALQQAQLSAIESLTGP